MLINYSNFTLPPHNSSLVVFGGTFDPIHQGHLEVVSQLSLKFSQILLAPTTSNPWKESQPTELKKRIEMLKLAIDSLPCKVSSKVKIWESGYTYAFEVVNQLILSQNLKEHIFWAIGEDLKEEVLKWKNWTELGITTLILPITLNIHAEEIRAGKKTPLSAIASYIRQEQLYR